MKPLRLEISALGPFVDTEVVDFAEIAGHTLLLLHGPTGSGKTTVLDAICFALFGDTSGAERDVRDMRSDHPDVTRTTQVVYDFALGERRFRVQRQPEQQRPSKRGDRMVSQPHKATLWERTDATDDDDEGLVLASKATDVTKAIEELLGFASEQFRQVVILPQGKFRKLLAAESKQKEAILERLFQTGLFARVAAVLGDKANLLKRRAHDADVAKTTILEQAGVDSVGQLDERIAAARLAHSSAKAALPVHKKTRDNAAEALSKGRQNQRLLDEVRQADGALQELAKQEAAFAKLRAVVTHAQKARPLVEVQAAVDGRRLDQKHRLQELADAKGDNNKAAAAKISADDNLKAEKARNPQRQAAIEEQIRLRDMVQAVQELAISHGELAKVTKVEKARKKQLGLAEQSQLAAAARVDELQVERGQVSSVASRVGEATLALDKAAELHHNRQQLVEHSAKVDAVGTAHEAAQEQLAVAKAQLTQQQDRLETLERQWQAGQAGALARRLQDGVACPVCGSSEHPQPAPSPDSLPTERDRDRGQQDVRSAAALYDERRDIEADVRQQLSAQQSAHDAIVQTLGELAVVEPTVVGQRLDVATQSLSTAQAAAERLLGIDAELATANTKTNDIGTAVTKARDQFNVARIAVSEACIVVEKDEQAVPAELRPPGALAAATKVVVDALTALARDLEKADVGSARSGKHAAAMAAKLQAAEGSATKASELLDEAQRNFDDKRAEAGFGSIGEFEAARGHVANIGANEAQIKTYDGSRTAAADRLARASVASEGVAAPDLAALQSSAQLAEEQFEAGVREHASLKQSLAMLGGFRKDYEATAIETAALEAEYSVVGRVANLARGQVPPNISFQRFVLGALLDEVLSAATDRLQRMSKGRYHLQRTSQSRHRSKATGLDMVITDSYTGQARPVSTLSGGESFLAALSLSLGLADVVQAFSGGIRLDTLFIDEGFGTLDQEALDLSLDTLTELNVGGRLVGIISHVPELKERISTRLEVTPGDRGSTTRFVVG